jgi:hypothetical protein
LKKIYEALGLTPKRNRSYIQRSHGKAERFLKALKAESTYGRGIQTSEEQSSRLPRYQVIYNSHRFNVTMGSRTPFEHICLLTATE